MKLYDALQSKTLRRAAVTAGLFAIAGGAAAAFLASRFGSDGSVGYPILAALLVATVLATPIVAAGFVLHSLDERQRQATALIAIRPLMGDLPLALGRWAIDAHFGELVVRTIADRRPGLVVECGSGTSTIIAAECLRRLGNGHVVSFEHNPGFADETRRQLSDRGLDGFATVVTAPITQRVVDGKTLPWYHDVADHAINAPIDLLVVDGPNRQIGPMARSPAIPLLGTHLAPDATILMDDGNRSDESRIASMWARRLNASIAFIRGGKGAWILHRGHAST